MLTTYDHDEYVFEALAAGASGFLLKESRPEAHPHVAEAAVMTYWPSLTWGFSAV